MISLLVSFGLMKTLKWWNNKMYEYSCECGALTRPISSVNEVVKDLICPLCKSNLKAPDLSKQTKLENYHSLDENNLSIMRQKILDELKCSPATDSELTKRLGYSDPNKVRPRRYELVVMNLVKELRKRECCITGKKVIEWGIVKQQKNKSIKVKKENDKKN